MITEMQSIEAQMVEFDMDVRYLRLQTPGVKTKNWFAPQSDGVGFGFMAVDMVQNEVLEAAYQLHQKTY